MANMRVHELAKEFGMTSKELLEHLHELKIPAKNHASTLIEPYVDKIRKELADVIEERQKEMEEKRRKKEEAERKKREKEEAERREQEQAERKEREEEERRKREEEERKRREAAAEAERKEREEEEERKAEEEARRIAEEKERKEREEAERYRRMAREAEKAEREKRVLAEAQHVASEAAKTGPGKKKPKPEAVAEEPAKTAEPAKIETIEAEAGEKAPAGAVAETEPGESGRLTLNEGVTVGEFAEAVGESPNEIIKRLFMLGQPLTVTQTMSDEIIEIIAEDLGYEAEIVPLEAELGEVFDDAPEDLQPRPPVVTVMGHVDHGKTSLLDAIRETGVAETEAGGITQHIGASVVHKNGKQITFIDTPGHEAFTQMRARGANLTDVAILVVAADDGVMPQTVEAIDHAKAAEVPIIIAVNKIDKPDADPNRVRQELTEYELVPEDWGGEQVYVDVSAKQRENIDDLLEMILLVSDVQELSANPDAPASGVVIEAELDRGRGPVATLLIQRGTLRIGDPLVAGTAHGRVRALIDPFGRQVREVVPADPVEVLGLSSVPAAGDEFRVMDDERGARELAEEREFKRRMISHEQPSHMSLDDLFARIQEGEIPEVKLVVKADTQGSIEAVKDALGKIDQSEVRISVIHSGVGGITETDITLADASDAIVVGFNVRPEPGAKTQAEKTGVDLRLYTVIYKVVEDINAARVGMLAPEYHEEETARVEVRETFKVPKAGTVAGCYVLDGEVHRDDQVRVVRDGAIVYDGELASLRRFTDDVKEVRSGYECGIGIEGFQDVKVGDILETYRTVEVAREA